MIGSSASRQQRRFRPPVGSARWFRRYRAAIVGGWLAVVAALLWGIPLKPAPPRGVAPIPAAESGKSASAPQAAAVTLPADDAPHENTTEWWYYSGQLQTESGERYSFHQATFLRQGTLAHTAFHGSLRDHQSGKHYTNQARTEGKPFDGRRDGFAFSYEPWQISGNGAQHALKMAGKGFAVDLALNDKQPPLLHQAPATPVAGLLDFGAAGWSYYTSRPRLSAQGQLTIDGVSKTVRGEVWFDHQWGDFDASALRWNWFALQLSDGADLMLYELFDRDGVPVLRMGTYAKDAKVTALGAADFKAAARSTWKSKQSNVAYPVDWTIAVASKGIDLKLDPISRQSQFDARLTTLNVYWEGAVKLSGSHTGIGFQELSGYPPEPATIKK